MKLRYYASLLAYLSAKLSELHESDVGDTNGVKVEGVADLKNVSIPSSKSVSTSAIKGLVGARVLLRLGRSKKMYKH